MSYKPGDEVRVKLHATVDFLHAKVVHQELVGYRVTILVFEDEILPDGQQD